VGLGASIGIDALLKKGDVYEQLATIISSGAYSGTSWVEFTARAPFNFGDIESAPSPQKIIIPGPPELPPLGTLPAPDTWGPGADCTMASASVPGYSLVFVAATGNIWIKNAKGNCVNTTALLFGPVNCSSPSFQTSAGGSLVRGKFLRVDNKISQVRRYVGR